MDDIVAIKVYYSTILVIALLMNTFLYCGAGELIIEHVSYTVYTGSLILIDHPSEFFFI